MKRTETTWWTLKQDGSSVKVRINMDLTKLGTVIARACKSKRGIATAANGAIVIKVLERKEGGDV